AVVLYFRRPLPVYDLVVFPYETAEPLDSSLGGALTRATRWYFEPMPSIRMPHASEIEARWNGSDAEPEARVAEVTRRLRATVGTWAVARLQHERLEVEVRSVNANGTSLFHGVIPGDTADLLTLADSMGARLVGAFPKGLSPLLPQVGSLAAPPREAVLEYM